VDAIRVTVRRGRVVEAVHHVHAVAFQDGAVVAEAGEAGLVSHYRSSSKPLQALQLVRALPGIDNEQLAIATASHKAEPAQLQAVRKLLDTAHATEGMLECGLQEGRVPEFLYHTCSGKHAGMLAVCRERGWQTAGYGAASHPLQQAILADVAETAEVREAEVPTAVDGCGVLTFALPLERMAAAFARLEQVDGGRRVVEGMRARPDLIGGKGSLETELMNAADWAAKGGLEGLFCAVAPDGLAIALKCDDGNFRALRPALGRFLEVLERPVASIGTTPVANSRGETVGEIAVE
jgi:L-asparaginase II